MTAERISALEMELSMARDELKHHEAATVGSGNEVGFDNSISLELSMARDELKFQQAAAPADDSSCGGTSPTKAGLVRRHRVSQPSRAPVAYPCAYPEAALQDAPELEFEPMFAAAAGHQGADGVVIPLAKLKLVRSGPPPSPHTLPPALDLT